MQSVQFKKMNAISINLITAQLSPVQLLVDNWQQTNILPISDLTVFNVTSHLTTAPLVYISKLNNHCS